jgi:hypothetical protein
MTSGVGMKTLSLFSASKILKLELPYARKYGQHFE